MAVNAKGIETTDCFAPPYFEESVTESQALDIGNCFYKASNFNKNLNLQYAQSWYRFASDLGHPTAHENLEKIESELVTAKGELTPLGGTLSGNADGSIPSWDGGLQTPPDTYVKGGPMVNPFADESPIYEINAANYKDHAQFLSDGRWP